MTATKPSKARFKDFGSPKRADEYEPLTFKLCGKEFACKGAIPGNVLLKFIAAADSNDGGRAAEAMRTFFYSVMEEEEAERFYALLDGDEYIVDMIDLVNISSWIIEEYSERPTQAPTPSSSGRAKAGTTSTAAAS